MIQKPMSSGGTVRVPKLLIENLQHEVERLRGQLLDSGAQSVDREKLRDRFVEASAALWALVQHVRTKDNLSKRFLDASSPLWTLVQDQADEIDHARQHVARTASAVDIKRADHWLDQLYGHMGDEAEAGPSATPRAAGWVDGPAPPGDESDDFEGESAARPAGTVAGPEAPLGSSPDPRAQTPADPSVAGQFVAWCRENTLMVNRVHLFEARLQNVAPGVRVETVSRDRYEREVVLRRGAPDGPEYWLMVVGDTYVILPQPVRASEFRELAPVFSGDATPESLTGISPAKATLQDGVFKLVQQGAVRARP